MSDTFSSSEADTVAAGRVLGQTLGPGAVVLLTGPLGAGKTAFVRGLADGLGANPDDVSSPTFAIVQEYAGPVRVQHVDLYRLKPEEVDDLALEDLAEHCVMAIEWPDRWRRAPLEAVAVEIDVIDDHTRRIDIRRP